MYVLKLAQILSYKSALYVPLEFVLENKLSLKNRCRLFQVELKDKNLF